MINVYGHTHSPAIGKHNFLLLTFVLFSWLCLVQYGACAKQQQQKCRNDHDCVRQGLNNHCCVKVTDVVGVCQSNLKKHQICPLYSIKFMYLRYGGIVRNKCSCGHGLTCTRIERKNWNKKLTNWSKQKRRTMTRFKFKCKQIDSEPEEKIESK